MKLTILLALAGLSVVLPACTTVHNDPAPVTTTTETTETRSVRAPVSASSTTTTVRSAY